MGEHAAADTLAEMEGVASTPLSGLPREGEGEGASGRVRIDVGSNAPNILQTGREVLYSTAPPYWPPQYRVQHIHTYSKNSVLIPAWIASLNRFISTSCALESRRRKPFHIIRIEGYLIFASLSFVTSSFPK